MAVLLLLSVLIVGCCYCDSHQQKNNILVLSPYTMPSHSNFVRPVVKELASRGHYVTYWNGLEPTINDAKLRNNLRQLYSQSTDELIERNVALNDRGQQFYLLFSLYGRTVNICKTVYNDPIFKQLMATNEHFDLVIVEGFLNECVLPLVHKLKAPLVYLNGIAPMPWLLEAIGSPLAMGSFPSAAISFTDRMNFWQRTLNIFCHLISVFFRNWVLMPTVDCLAAQMLTNISLPSVRTIEQESLSLLITNTHSSINYQLPMTPNVIEAGGLHCAPGKPLPKVKFSFTKF